ncbi:MAG: hypothetical protein ACOX0A_03370 [Thermoguttaceae bacterium]|jgi:hypothetical protein
MTIRVTCKNCGSKLHAKDELLGQTRRCPKCKNPVLIEPSDPVAATPAVENPEAEDVGLKQLQLRQDNLYVILGVDKEVAYWKANEGWFLNVGNGFQSIKRVSEQIPDVGNFVFVEGYVEQTPEGRRLRGMRFRALHGRGVLNALIRSETEILEKASEPTTLSQAQKRFMLQHIRQHYFMEFTDGAPELIEYLTGFDAHAHEVGQFVDE